MDENITFYYAVWSNRSNIKDRWWINLLFSIITLRSVYPKNKIKIICYTEPPKEFLKFQNSLNYNVKYIKQYYKDYNPKRFNIELLSKLQDCFEMSFSEKEKVILVDSDVFIIKKFTDINWEKVGVYGTHNRNVNTGVVIFDTNKESVKEYRRLFMKEIEIMLDESIDLVKYIDIAYKGIDPTCKMQEENTTRHIFYKYKEIINTIFYDIGIKNNGINCQDRTDTNNFHLMHMHLDKIAEFVSNHNYFKKHIVNFFKNEKEFEIISHLYKQDPMIKFM
jgi:hypothetical protein